MAVCFNSAMLYNNHTLYEIAYRGIIAICSNSAIAAVSQYWLEEEVSLKKLEEEARLKYSSLELVRLRIMNYVKLQILISFVFFCFVLFRAEIVLPL